MSQEGTNVGLMEKLLQEHLGSFIRFIITLLLMAIALWWLIVVSDAIDVFPKRNSAGDIVDEFARSKDVLLFVLPLLGTALGYWFGASGKEKAEEQADEAQTAAAKAHQQLSGVLDSSSEQGLIEKAKEKYPDAFR